MNTIAVLVGKYPGKTPVAIDCRSTNVKDGSIKDWFCATANLQARKPRSRDLVTLNDFDEELGVFVGVEKNVVYYMPGTDDPPPVYATSVALGESNLDTVALILRSALNQCLQQCGEMMEKEARIFWTKNAEQFDTHPLIHTTVVREKREYRVVAEVGRNEAARYTSLFSIGFSTEDEIEA